VLRPVCKHKSILCSLLCQSSDSVLCVGCQQSVSWSGWYIVYINVSIISQCQIVTVLGCQSLIVSDVQGVIL
jgi:hypothetical protein